MVIIKKEKSVMPFLKWVGGKRQLLPTLIPLLPEGEIDKYCEPFLGGGAMFFSLQPKIAYVNDINNELIGVYKVIRNEVDALIDALRKFENSADYFYEVRDWDRDKEKYDGLSNVEKAARIIYLNKTCYNGLFRVNLSGEFNTPFGNYKNPNIINAPVLHAVSDYLNSNEVHFYSCDYAELLSRISCDTFVYLDPPYDPISDTSSFTGYVKGGFGREQQIRLRECCDQLTNRGIKFMLSNSATEFILEQYANYNIEVVQAKRAINSNAAKRGAIDEVVIRNYG